MLSRRYAGFVESIRSSLDVDILTVRFGEIGGHANNEMTVQLKRDEENGLLYRAPVMLDLTIEAVGQD